ncbi:hypothetical protein [Halobaculum sp. P14]|uniref:hypothetical protein n=1 Tax=Halobaculum sp. P14 TaxID=3421638 RepID=UPI003EBD7766
MPSPSLLRFGVVGTAVLAALPLALAARYVFGAALLRRTADVRPPTEAERDRLRRAAETAGVDAADRLDAVVSTESRAFVGLAGTPRRRLLVLSAAALSDATDAELAGLVGVAAGQDDARLPELYAAVLFALGVAFAVAVGVDPSGFGSVWTAGAVVAGLVGAVAVAFPLLRRRTYAADRAAAARVDADRVAAALAYTDACRLPEWVPAALRPKPSPERRRTRL